MNASGEKTGRLFVLATPLGNLEDLTLRGLRLLNEAHLVAAEDTRRTRKLLSRYEISTPLVSYREENHARVLPRLLAELEAGRDLVLVSDAGTPGVSDPGLLLVQAACELGAAVTPLPGPSAVTAAVSISGLGGEGFLFAGFLPARSSQRRQAIESLKGAAQALVLFEAPHRLKGALADLAALLGPRQAVICRELTKIHEEILRGTLTELEGVVGAREGIKGEITLVIAPAAPGEAQARLTKEEAALILKQDPRPLKEAAKGLAGRTELSRAELYRLGLVARGRR